MTNDNIEIINLVPKFLDFYNKACTSVEELRFDLWKKYYGFAAVPPGEKGEQLAKELLDGAWDKYEDAFATLRSWTPNCDMIQRYLSEIKRVLNYNEVVDVVIVFFVGAFEENAFTAPYGEDRIAVCLPIENGENEITIVHELTHFVQGKIMDSIMKWERTVVSIVFQEGLATHMSKYLIPGYKDEVYVEIGDGWLKKCSEDAEQIIQGIKQYLYDSSSEKVWQFTMGEGTTGKIREAYYVGWRVIGNMLGDGWSFSDIAKIKEDDMVDTMMKYCRIL